MLIRASLLLALLLALPVKSNNLDKIQSVLVKPAAMQGSFTQEKKISVLTNPLLSDGEFWLAQNQGLIWRTNTPLASELIISEQGIHFSEQLSGNMERSMRHISNIFNALLAANFIELEKQFDITSSEINSNNIWSLQLTPKSLLIKKALSKITLSGSTALSTILLQEQNGDHTLITLSNVEYLKAVPEFMSEKLSALTKTK